MAPYIIKPLETESEMDGKGLVHFQSWHETYTALVSPAYMKTVTQERCIAMAHRWPENTLIAKDGDRVIGFACYGLSRDEDLPDAGEVIAIYVLAEYYGKKIGYELMNAALEQIRDHPKVAVWVLKGNERAIRFYERYGFRFDGAKKEIMLGTPNEEQRMIFERKSDISNRT